MDRLDLQSHSGRMDFVAKLKWLMQSRGWKQSHLARVSGVADSTVSHWLKGKIKGKPDLDTGLKLARAFGVTLDYLADDGMDQPEPGLSDGELELLKLGRRVGIDEAIDRIVIKHEVVPRPETYGQRKRRNEANNHS